MKNIHLSDLAFLFLAYSLFAFTFTSCINKPQQIPEGFELHPDFDLELAAAEPLVFDPVDIEFDEFGSAFVIEMPGYPLRDEDSRVILLKDHNSDGIYDERVVFADNLGVASSLMCYKNGLLIAAPPYLLWIGDKDNDGKADLRDTIMSGFSEGNLQHNFNGLTYGLDNWIYAANGGNSGNPYFGKDKSTEIDLRGDDLKFKLYPNVIERVGKSSGGFELAFDKWGRMFETHNLEHISHLVFEDRFIAGLAGAKNHTLTNISDHDENGLSRIYPIGEQETRVNHPEQSGYFSGACGVTYYGASLFPDPYKEALFVADCVLNLVHIDLLKEDKSSFKTRRDQDKSEFLASSDRSFRPVNMTMGPDGALYLIDMYREVIEHPEWIPDDIEASLDLSSGKEKGRIYRIIPKGVRAHKSGILDRSDPSKLILALENENGWIRNTAQRLLVEESSPLSADQIETAFTISESPIARTHMLWTLEGLGAFKPSLIISGLTDPSSGVRENSLRIAENHLTEDEELLSSAMELLSDPHPRVRTMAALVISTLPDEYYQTHGPTIVDQIVSQIRGNSNDEWNNLALLALSERKADEMVLELLGRGPDNWEGVNSDFMSVLGTIIARNHDFETVQLIISHLSRSKTDPVLTAILLESFVNGLENDVKTKPGQLVRQEIDRTLTEIENTESIPIVRAAAMLRMNLGLRPSLQKQKLLKTAYVSINDHSQPIEERMTYLKLIGLEPFEAKEDILFKMLDHSEPIALQEESLQQLWDAKQTDTGQRLVSLWPALGPHARRIAGDILLYSETYHDALLTGLESGQINIGEMNFDLERRRTLLWWTDNEETKKRAEALFKDSGVLNRKEVMDEMRPSLALKGTAKKGKEVFLQLCSQCHQYGDVGEDVGPLLTEISRKSKQSLLHDIIDPNAAVDTKYINHKLVTNSGKTHIGIIDAEGDNEITIKKLGGTTVTVLKNQIAEFSSLGTSMMMEGLEATMSHQDLADLLSYLQTQG